MKTNISVLTLTYEGSLTPLPFLDKRVLLINFVLRFGMGGPLLWLENAQAGLGFL